MTAPGENGQAGDRTSSDSDPRTARDAEQIAGDLAEKFGRSVLRTVARAREEAEDIWAEAQALRREL